MAVADDLWPIEHSDRQFWLCRQFLPVRKSSGIILPCPDCGQPRNSAWNGARVSASAQGDLSLIE